MATDKGLEEIPEGRLHPRYDAHTAVCSRKPADELRLTLIVPTGQIESNYDETVDSFDTMNLKPELLRGMFWDAHFATRWVNK